MCVCVAGYFAVQLENILFTNDGDMKLVDFGFSVMCRDPSKKLKIFCGTPSYMAPEIVMRKCVTVLQRVDDFHTFAHTLASHTHPRIEFTAAFGRCVAHHAGTFTPHLWCSRRVTCAPCCVA